MPAPQVQDAPAAAAAAADLGTATRADFPILHQSVNERPLMYLDNAATSQKPRQVLQTMDEYYGEGGYNSNVHRGVHALSARATAAYEAAREKIAGFINASSPQEIVYTRNATEAINLVANTWGAAQLREGDEVVLSVAEHHSNIVPWQLLAQRRGLVLKFAELTGSEEVDLEKLAALITPRTRLVSLVHVSNMLGCVLPTQRVAEMAHGVGAKLLLDCCQSVPNMPVDVQTLGADWIVASSHKMCGPTGIGFLWARYSLLEQMPPWMGGGEMIQEVRLEGSTYAEPPSRFEAGTPAIAEAIGLGAACDYLSGLGMERVAAHERELGAHLYWQLRSIDRVRIYGPSPEARLGRAALATFNVEGIHPTDISTILDSTGVAVRSGHLCTQPVHRHLGISSSVRASPYIYNTKAEVDAFVDALKDAIQFFT
ncbi:hypothetical protein CHLNCDRAFT_34562 [Chlorella variabilis]|uniref:cysteine desulfurase n=1 Tax=Chlorella variabilis TaxID=554065 RepID=E1Z8I3_CHLVA|nr:hypothetical protein CHLNCDRAFT_34562 [Chlorella variabilis]EFN57615.1 hypothetical protein CHLNCDRAFT_34562 [Chlorella variabilis]|eukprot:XP_005849717.1 hypothetical protein CHLNCDRAFT_34562 [Chlorella variabilis]